MEDVRESHSMPLFASSPKESKNTHPVASTIDALATMLRTRFETRRHIATMSGQWLREHEADYSKHG
jgi:hypothetical protein